MTIAIKRYKDGTYTPLSNPLSRRIDYGDINDAGEYTPKKKKTRVQRYQEEVKAGTYKKNFIDKFVDRVLSR